MNDKPHNPWPGGVVPYHVPNNLLNPKQLTVLQEAMGAIQESTCVKFVSKNDSDKIFLNIQTPIPVGNAPIIGYSGVTQPIFITLRGTERGWLTPVIKHETIVGNIIHDLLHVLGLSDENNRPDRNDSVTVEWSNIKREELINFAIDKAAVTYNMPYNYQSIMHQKAYFGSKSYSPSLKPKREATRDGIEMGQRKGMTCSDILKINFHYNCTKHLTTERKSNYLLKGTCPAVVIQSSAQASDENEGYMYYAKDKGIYEMSLSNYNDTDLMVNTTTEDIIMDVDCSHERIFWFDQLAKQICWVYFWNRTIILKASFNAREFPRGVGGIVFNLRINHLYLTNPGKKSIAYMRVANLTITNITGQIFTEWTPQGITFDHRSEFLFFYECKDQKSHVNFQCRIVRARITQVPIAKYITVILKEHTLLFLSESRTLHASFEKIYAAYWTLIFSCDYDGNNREVFSSIASSMPLHIGSSKDWLYWTATGGYPYSYLRIFRAKKAQNDSVSWIKEKQVETDVKNPEHYSGINVCRLDKRKKPRT